MDSRQVAQIRRFNRAVTRRIGALEESYLSRGRPLGEARVIFEVGSRGGVDVKALRQTLGLDSGYMSRLLRSLEKQGMVQVGRSGADGRVRELILTPKGQSEFAAYDKLSDGLAEGLLSNLTEDQRARLVNVMAEVERLLSAGAVVVSVESARSADARSCLDNYYAELAERFEDGFDPTAGNTFDAAEMTPPEGWFVVARSEGQAVGCGALKVLAPAVGEIKRVWTAPQARGLGVARRIMQQLEATATHEGLTTVRLDTNKALTEAHALYASLGYRAIERYNDNPYAHRWFEKSL